jgi:hypothetical protein
MLNRSQIYALLMLRARGDNIFGALPRDIVRYIGDRDGVTVPILTTQQIYTLLMLRKREGNFFSHMPKDIIQYRLSVFTHNPSLEILKLLHHIAYGDLVEAKHMLDAHPRLVLGAGNVITPSGLEVMRTTPLECALGAGDPEMAEMIAPFFEQFENGIKEQEEQYARYRPHIENILKQPGYDFNPLLDLIIQSSPEDITAALQHKLSAESPLYKAFQKFRAHFTPGKMTVGMHFNYQDLLNAFGAFDQKWAKLCDENNFEKNILFCRQVIGFIQRNLPAVDRQVFAQGLFEVAAEKTKSQRSFKFKGNQGDFPVTAGDVSCTGLGFDYCALAMPITGVVLPCALDGYSAWKMYVEQKKLQTCSTYAATARREVVSVCNLLK